MASDPTLAARILSVNGRPREVFTEDETALLYVLRNHLGLKGSRFGCGSSWSSLERDERLADPSFLADHAAASSSRVR